MDVAALTEGGASTERGVAVYHGVVFDGDRFVERARGAAVVGNIPPELFWKSGRDSVTIADGVAESGLAVLADATRGEAAVLDGEKTGSGFGCDASAQR